MEMWIYEVLRLPAEPTRQAGSGLFVLIDRLARALRSECTYNLSDRYLIIVTLSGGTSTSTREITSREILSWSLGDATTQTELRRS